MDWIQSYMVSVACRRLIRGTLLRKYDYKQKDMHGMYIKLCIAVTPLRDGGRKRSTLHPKPLVYHPLRKSENPCKPVWRLHTGETTHPDTQPKLRGMHYSSRPCVSEESTHFSRELVWTPVIYIHQCPGVQADTTRSVGTVC